MLDTHLARTGHIYMQKVKEGLMALFTSCACRLNPDVGLTINHFNGEMLISIAWFKKHPYEHKIFCSI